MSIDRSHKISLGDECVWENHSLKSSPLTLVEYAGNKHDVELNVLKSSYIARSDIFIVRY